MAAASAGAGAGNPGGILGLLQFLTEHRQALEFDLIKLGLRARDIGEPWLTWEDFRTIVRQLQQERGSALALELNGQELVDWTLTNHLLATVFDSTNLVNWHLRWLGGENVGDPPEPLPRPGIKSKTVQWTGNPVTIEEMDRKLGWRQN